MMMSIDHHTRTARGATMQRVTITIDEDLVAELERYMVARGYANRSHKRFS
jgi:hypothetical protein